MPRRLGRGGGLLLSVTAALVLAQAPGASALEAPAPAQPCPPAAPPSVAPAVDLKATPPSPAAEAILVCVAQRPITGATYSHWLTVALKLAVAPRHRGKRHARSHGTLAQSEEVLGFLISSDWVLGEAADLGIAVAPATVMHSFERIRHEQFPRRHEYRAFLRSSGETTADILYRVELNLLSSRIQRRVEGGGSPTAQGRALQKFVAEFKAKWVAQTYCAAPYRSPDCGHVEAAL